MDENNVKGRVNQELKRKEGTLSYSDMVEAYQFFGGTCPYSQTPIDNTNWHLEHIIPVVMGGTTDPWNCIPVCGPCNLSKGSKHLLDWWDDEHKIEEEYKLERIFLYIVNSLNKERSIRISTKEDKELVNQLLLQEQEDMIESLQDDSYTEYHKELDTFTFLFQLLNHLKQSNQISSEKIKKMLIYYKNCMKKILNLKNLILNCLNSKIV